MKDLKIFDRRSEEETASPLTLKRRSSADLIKIVADVDLRTKIFVEGLQAGQHRSVFKGQGIEFTDIREYVPGDDIRAIDWNVTARLDRPYIKEFTEERTRRFTWFPIIRVPVSSDLPFPSSRRCLRSVPLSDLQP